MASNDEPTYNTKPPIAEERLVEIVKAWRRDGGGSDYVPRNYLTAATWWMDRQEPAGPNERPQVGYNKDGEQHWTTPYIERVTATFRAFLDLSEPQKCFVLESIAADIPYRGDSIKFYKAVVEEAAKMREAKAEGKLDEYIDAGFESMQEAVKGMTV